MPDQTPWYIASVNRTSLAAIHDWVAANRPGAKAIQLKNSDFPIKLAVDRPDAVGTDRVAGATAVNVLRKATDKNACAIFSDAGTAITVNALDENGTFLGGAILPGTTTASRALNKSTDQLPEVRVRADQDEPTAIGSDTNPAIASGIYWGSVGAVQMLIQRMASEFPNAKSFDRTRDVYITGGFGPALAQHLEPSATYIPHLVLSGIALAARHSR